MAISVVTGGVSNYTASRSPSFTLDASPVENDIIVLFVAAVSNGTLTGGATPAGWVNTLGGGTVVAPGGAELAMAAAYHVVTNAEDTANTVTWTLTNLWSGTNTGDVAAVVFRGVDTAAVVDAFGTASDSANTVTPHVLPALASGDVTTTNDMVVRAVAKDATGTYTAPAGHTEQRTSNTNQGLWVGTHDTLTTAGNAVAATNITPSAGDEYAAISLALSPIASGDATVSATTVATTTALPAPAVQTGSVVSATTIATTTALPAPAVGAAAVVLATTIATTTAMPAPAVQTGSVVSAVTVQTTTALPEPTISVPSNATVTVTTIVTRTAISAPSVTTVPDVPDVAPQAPGSWWGLLKVYQDAAALRAYEASQPPVACPNDGTPLLASPHAVLFCPFCGWRHGE